MAPILPTHDEGNAGDYHHGPKRFIPNRVRNELVAATAEFCGTFMFLFFAFGAAQVADAAATVESGETIRANHSISQVPNASTLLYISLASGFSLVANVWVFYRISGGLFNPAVTLGLYLAGVLKPVRAVVCFVAQILASIAATAVVSGILPNPLNVSTTLSNGTSITRGVFLEMLLTAELVFTVFMLAVEKHKATYLAPVGIGLVLFVAEMTGVFFTGGSLNPARSFGPAVVTGHFDGYHWIYWVGPFLGTLLAYGLYELMKALEYKTVNPGQDFNDQEDKLFQPPEDPSTPEQVATPNMAAQMTDQVARQVAEQVAQVVIDRILSGLPEVVDVISSSQSEANGISSTLPKFRVSQTSTSAGLPGHDGAAAGEVQFGNSTNLSNF